MMTTFSLAVSGESMGWTYGAFEMDLWLLAV